jgi:hypothetical protein
MTADVLTNATSNRIDRTVSEHMKPRNELCCTSY